MTLIHIKNKKVLALPNLLRYVLKFIYDESNMSSTEIQTMQESFVDWNNTISLEDEKLFKLQARDLKTFGHKITTEHKYSEEKLQLENLACLLRDNDEGKLDNRKALFKNHDIDYRKFHRLPEAYTLQDFINGQETLEEHKRTNPDDYR